MSKSLEMLQQEMPAVFEHRDNLVRQVAEATAGYHLFVEGLNSSYLSPAQIETERARACDRFYLAITPIRAEIDAINGRIATALAMFPPDPITIPR